MEGARENFDRALPVPRGQRVKVKQTQLNIPMKTNYISEPLNSSLRAASLGLVFAVLTILFGQGLGIVFGLNEDARARRLERFLTQTLFTTEQFTGLKGKLVSLEDALNGCERILRDEFKDYLEGALYMIGAIDEAKKKAPPDKPAAKTKPEFKLEVQTEVAAKPKPESEEKS